MFLTDWIREREDLTEQELADELHAALTRPEWLAEWQRLNDRSRWPDRGERNDEVRGP